MEMVFLFLILLSTVFSVQYSPSDTSSILFGMSCPMTGPSQDLGIELSNGIQISFDRVNENGGVLGGKMLNLSILDDLYEPVKTINNTNIFLNSSEIFSLLAYVGTPTTLAVSDEIQEASVPLIGPYTGASFLRSPFNDLFINIRASYDDEATSMINYVIRKKYRLGISMLYQNDSFGNNTYKSLIRSLDPYNIDILSTATYNRNSVDDIDDAVIKISEAQPDAVVLAGTYEPVGKFIARYQELVVSDLPPIFLVFSFVGTVPIAEELEKLNTTLENTIVFQTVPNIILEEHDPSTVEYKLVSNYLSALSSSGINTSPTFIGLEGYLLGRFVVESIRSTFGEFTRENYLKSIFEMNQEYYIDGFKLGPFQDAPVEDQCNQGLRSVYPVRLINSSYFETVEEARFDWEGCLSEPTISKPVIFLKQSTPTSGSLANIGMDYMAGVKSALFKWNTQRSLEERIIGIVTKDDSYNSTLTRLNTIEFLEDTTNPTFGFVGYVGTPTFGVVKDLINETKTPSIGFFSGSDILREDGMYNVINLRVGYNEEVFSLAQYALDMKMTRISIFYMTGFDDLKDSLVSVLEFVGYDIMWIETYNHGTHDFNFTNEVNQLFGDEEEIPEVVIILSTFIPIARFLYEVYQKLYFHGTFTDDIYFGAWSPVDPLDLIEELKSIGCNTTDCLSRMNLFFSEVVPYFNDTTKPIVQEYLENMYQLGFSDHFGFVSMEGFLNGLLITNIMEEFSNEEIDDLQQDQFLDKVYELQTIRLFDISLGPYVKDDDDDTLKFCNTGLREAWFCHYNKEKDSIETSSRSVTFPYCSGDTESRNDLSTFIRSPVFFGFSNDFETENKYNKTKEFGMSLEYGMSSQSTENIMYNLYLIQKDDEGDPERLSDNIEYFDEIKKVFGYVGFESSTLYHSDVDETKVIFGLSDPVFGDTNSNILYFRPFLIDEIFYAVQYYREEESIEPAVLIGKEETNKDYEIMKKYFEQYLIKTIEGTIDEILENNLDEYSIIIYSLDDISILNDDILPRITTSSKPTFVFPSQYDRFEYTSIFEDYEDFEYHQITFFSRSSLFYEDFVTSTYGSELEYVDHAFYGYVLGKWISTNFVSSLESGDDFFSQALDSSHSITFDQMVIDFQGGECHVGVRDIFLYDGRTNELLTHVDLSIINKEEGLDYETFERRKCSLFDSFSASDHEEMSYEKMYWIFVPPTPVLFAGVFVNLFGCCVLVCCFLCCYVTVVSVFVFVSIILRSNKRLKKFNKLRDVDLLLKEQEMESNVDVAHLKINSRMFQIKISEIEFVKILGEGGSNSIVYKSKFRNKIVAFKCFRTTQFCASEKDFNEFEREVEVLSSISHPNIVSFYGACLDPPRVGFVMEFCELGDLAEFLKRHSSETKRFPYREKLRMVTEISSAVDYIHSRKIIHRDLKLENILVATGNVCKLMDFGLSRIVEGKRGVKLTKKIGTSDFMAPELIKSGDYNEKCDVFSFAIMLFVIFTENFQPYGENSYMVELQVAYSPDRRPNIDEVVQDSFIPKREKSFLVDLMVKLWDDSPFKRLGFDQITKLLMKRLEEYDLTLRRSKKQIPSVLLDGDEDDSEEKDEDDDDNLVECNSIPKSFEEESVTRVSPKKHFKYDGRKETVVWKKEEEEDKKSIDYQEKYSLLVKNVENVCSQDGIAIQRFFQGL